VSYNGSTETAAAAKEHNADNAVQLAMCCHAVNTAPYLAAALHGCSEEAQHYEYCTVRYLTCSIHLRAPQAQHAESLAS
jgi:uncharacterized protein (UPF0210 family)